jgi:phospholipid transport system substrate-binding protein
MTGKESAMTIDLGQRVLTRRAVLAGAAAILVVAAIAAPSGARAQQSPADAFVRGFADRLVAVVNGAGSADAKQAALAPLIDNDVDVAAIARFCLGRFWSSATPAQQAAYTQLFHQVLVSNISGHLGDYRGVSFTLTGSQPQGEDTLVGTIINRPSQPPANVQWVVRTSGGAPKVLDLVAEGTSLRLTQRQDYASYLSRHGGSIDALIAAMKRQLNG